MHGCYVDHTGETKAPCVLQLRPVLPVLLEEANWLLLAHPGAVVQMQAATWLDSRHALAAACASSVECPPAALGWQLG